MAEWYVKDLSKLTYVSVQTLHHYDRIGLLQPSIRLPNGYRVYSEKDLLKLQQIIALKFFGFELARIKELLADEVNVLDHLTVQAELLTEKAKALHDASETLKTIISACGQQKSVPWETLIQTIEVYHMTQELEKSWAGKVLSPQELKEYASFEQSLKTRFTLQEKEHFEKSWADLVKTVEDNLTTDPHSDFGKAIGKQCMEWVNSLYGKEFVKLRTAIWEKGFKGGHAQAEHKLNPQTVAWLDQAMDAYYRSRIYAVLNSAGYYADESSLRAWNEIMDEMYGDNEAPKAELVQAALQDEHVSPAGKKWLKKIAK